MRSGVLIPSIMCTDGCACMLMVERTCQLIPWLIAKQSDVTLRFTLDNICFWCQQLTCPPYTGLGGGSGTARIRSMPGFEATKAIRPKRGPLLNAYATDVWGARVPGEACGADARLLAFLSSYPIVTEHTPCSRTGMVTRLGCAQWLIQSE